jgi:hypothetical protein
MIPTTKQDKKLLSLVRRNLRRDNLAFPPRLVEVEENNWPEMILMSPDRPSRVLRSRFYLALLFEETVPFRMSVCISDIGSDGLWKDGLTWDDLQDIKRQAGFGEWWGFEAFPSEDKVVNVANMRHLWLFPQGLPFCWGVEEKQEEEAVVEQTGE